MACPRPGRQLRDYSLCRLSQSYSRSPAENAAAEFCALKMLMVQQLKAESQHAAIRDDIAKVAPLPSHPTSHHPTQPTPWRFLLDDAIAKPSRSNPPPRGALQCSPPSCGVGGL
jgi:hypothetical protein